MAVAGSTAAAVLADSAALDGASTTTTALVEGTTGSLGQALAGAGSEMLGDATTLVGDAVADVVSSAGSAVADAAVGVATDAAIGSTTVWGVWDGIHRIIPAWVFSGGAAVLGSELAFAALAFYLVTNNNNAENGEIVQETDEAKALEMNLVQDPSVVAKTTASSAPHGGHDSKYPGEAFQRELLAAAIRYRKIKIHDSVTA